MNEKGGAHNAQCVKFASASCKGKGIKKMSNPKPDPDKSRPYPHTYTGIEWASILMLLRRGLEATPVQDDREVQIVRKLLPELQETVKVLRELEPLGCGLDHPVWRELV